MKGLLRKFLLPVLLLIPISASGHYSEIKLGDKLYSVEVDDNRKIFGISPGEVTDKNTRRVLELSSINHQESLLELKLNELDYEIFEMIKKTVSNSKELSSRIKTLAEFFKYKASIPWEAFALKNLDTKVLACAEVWPDRTAARKFLKSINYEKDDEQMLYEEYDKLRDFVNIIDSASQFMRETRESTEVNFAITEEEFSDFKTKLHYGNFKALEELKNKIKERYQKSTQYQNYAKRIVNFKKDKETLGNIIGRYSMKNDSKELFDKSVQVSLNTSSQYDSALKTNLEVRIERNLESPSGSNLDVILSLENFRKEKKWQDTFVLNKSKSSLFIFYPQGCKFGDTEQSVYSLRTDMHSEVLHGNFEEIFPSGKDKEITMKMDAAEFTVKKAIAAAAPGHFLQISNALDWITEKIMKYENDKTEKRKSDLMDTLSQDYSSKEISLFPANSQYSGMRISIPVENQDGSVYLMMNVGVQDWEQKSLGGLENLIIEVNPGSASEKKEDIIIPPLWIGKIIRVCSPSKQDPNFLRPIENAPGFVNALLKQASDAIYGNSSGSQNPQCQKDESLKKINQEVYKIKRKDYGWIISEPFAKRASDGLLSVLSNGNYIPLNPNNDVPERVQGIFNDFADIDFVRQNSFERIGSAYCDLNFSGKDYGYYCYFPTSFNDNSTDFEFVDSISKMKMSNILPLENVFVSSRFRFYDGRALLEFSPADTHVK